MLAPGQRIDHYELVSRIGEGGMAHVWSARERSGGLIALKIIHSRFAENEAFRAMFHDEARIVSAVNHPNVARVFGLGGTGSLLYLVMEYVEGESLFSLIAPEKIVPLPVALRIVADTCAGLDIVHRAADAHGQPLRIVHRDVSPQNLLITQSGEVKIIDFGIAHARHRAVVTTDVSQVKGKVRYMAPEQARHETIGPATDVFAAGAVLFRMLSGRAPYAAGSDVQTIQALLAGSPPLAPLPADVPPGVVAAVMRAISPSVAGRYPTAGDFREALEGALSSLPRADIAAWFRANATHPTVMPPARGGTAPMPARPPDRARSFMDVSALAAKASSGQAPPDAPAPPDQAVPAPSFAVRAARAAPQSSDPSGGRPLRRALAVIAAVVVVAVFLLLLPTIARERVTATAREAGFILTAERVGVGLEGISLRGVTLKAPTAPGLTATAQEVFLEGFFGKGIRVVGLDATLDGSYADLGVPLGLLFQEDRPRFAGTPSSPHHLTIAGAHVLWTGPAGPGSRLDVSDIGLEIDSRGVGQEDMRGSTGKTLVETSTLHFGPWATSFDSAAASSRVRVMFDPPVGDGPSVLFTWGDATPLQMTLKIPRAPFTQLGMKSDELGLPADAQTEIEAQVDGKFPQTDRSQVTGTLTLWGARPSGFPGPIDIKINLVMGGVRGKAFDLDRTTVTLGPFTGAVSGTVSFPPTDFGVRVDAMVTLLSVPCDRVAKGTGPFKATLTSLGLNALGIKVTGSVNATAAVKYDSTAPTDASLTWIAKETCGVSLFGP